MISQFDLVQIIQIIREREDKEKIVETYAPMLALEVNRLQEVLLNIAHGYRFVYIEGTGIPDKEVMDREEMIWRAKEAIGELYVSYRAT